MATLQLTVHQKTSAIRTETMSVLFLILFLVLGIISNTQQGLHKYLLNQSVTKLISQLLSTWRKPTFSACLLSHCSPSGNPCSCHTRTICISKNIPFTLILLYFASIALSTGILPQLFQMAKFYFALRTNHKITFLMYYVTRWIYSDTLRLNNDNKNKS